MIKKNNVSQFLEAELPKIVALVTLFLMPLYSYASVVINEVAWMGTAVSATDEWVELYADSETDMTGWVLATEDDKMSVALSGSIPASGYYLIERTNDETVPGIAANVVAPFGSGISNGVDASENLLLKNASGIIVDNVGTVDRKWPAGDNTTKETMQKSGAGWITAAATPKAANAESAVISTTNTTNKTTSSSTPKESVLSSGGSSADRYTSPEKLPRIKVYAGEDKKAAVGEEVQFRAEAWGLEDEPLENARYLWNFGDGATQEGKNVGHVYSYPGTHIARLTVSSGKYTAFDDVRIDVAENRVMVSEVMPGAAGWIELQNAGSDPVHIGGWLLETSSAQFVIPAGTSMAPRSFAVLSAQTTKLFLNENGDHAHLFYPNGSFASGLSYVFQVPVGSSMVSIDSNTVLSTKPTPGIKNDVPLSTHAAKPTEQKLAASPLPVSRAPVAPPVVPKSGKEASAVISESPKVGIEEDKKTNVARVIDSSNTASVGTGFLSSQKMKETAWFGASLILGGVLAVATVFLRRRKQI